MMEEDCGFSDSCEDYPPFDSRTGSPLPPSSDSSMEEPNPTSQHEYQVPYANFHLHPHAIQDGGCHSPSPPLTIQDSDSDSSVRAPFWFLKIGSLPVFDRQGWVGPACHHLFLKINNLACQNDRLHTWVGGWSGLSVKDR